MIALITLIIGFILGLFIHMLTMKISFKQRTIDNKVKVYDSIITSWVKMRNQIFNLDNLQDKQQQINQIYGESQAYIGEIFLVTENNSLAIDLNDFNEKFYRKDWLGLDRATISHTLEELKDEALKLITRMREDIQDSTVLNRQDFFHILSGLGSKKSV